jgi:hypothetical protein
MSNTDALPSTWFVSVSEMQHPIPLPAAACSAVRSMNACADDSV